MQSMHDANRKDVCRRFCGRPIMNRRVAREKAFELIYEMDFHKDEDYLEIYANARSARELEDNDFMRETFVGVYNNRERIDEIIAQCAVGWKVDRISAVTLAIMRLSVYEMVFSSDVPVNVSLNEAVELAKKFDEDSAPAFINGVLNKVAKEFSQRKDNV